MKTFCLVLLLTISVLTNGQEIKYVSVDVSKQRTQLRYPPTGAQSSCGIGAQCIDKTFKDENDEDGYPDKHNPRALGAYLERISATTLTPSKPFDAEFRIVNTGTAPIKVPVSPHLTDLQETDSAPLNYYSLTVSVRISGAPEGADVGLGAQAELYGSAKYKDTIVTLNPGEWIRVKVSNMKFLDSVSLSDAWVRGDFWMGKTTYVPQPGGVGTASRTKVLYPNNTVTPSLAVHLTQP